MKRFIGTKSNEIITVRHIDDIYDENERLFYTYSINSDDIIQEELKAKYGENFVLLTEIDELELQYNILMDKAIELFKKEFERVANLYFSNTVVPLKQNEKNSLYLHLPNQYDYFNQTHLQCTTWHIVGVSVNENRLMVVADEEFQPTTNVFLTDVDVAIILLITKEMQNMTNKDEINFFCY